MLRELLSNKTTTLNGALTNVSTNSALVDLFGAGGASRRMSETDIINLFEKARLEDEESAIVLMFYFRDIIGGQGERRFFRVLLKHLGNNRPAVAEVLIPYVPEFGRWDDLYALVDTPLEGTMFRFMEAQFDNDLHSETPTLLAKWLKGTRPSSPESKRLMRKTYQAFGIPMIQYQKQVAALRKRIGIVETQMCNNEWDKIDYAKVPSQAMKQYLRAFGRHDAERFGEYLEAIENKVEGVKINAKTLYPHQIVAPFISAHYAYGDLDPLQARGLSALWKSLPEYALYDTLPVIDVSGSMTMGYATQGKTIPMHASIGLGLYAAEHLKGEFKDSFITFDSNPTFIQFSEKETFEDRVAKTMRAPWGGSTNLEKVFRLVLGRAVIGNVPQEEMPRRILIISDMEFDSCTQYGETIYENAQKLFKQAGYQLPQVVFWNVDSKTEQYPITETDNALLLSGFSPVILKFLYRGELLTPIDLVMEVVDDERYMPIKEALLTTRKW